MIDIEELERLALAATPGPWTIDKDSLDPRKCLYVAKGTPDDLRGRVLEVFVNCLVRSPGREANADFIVAIRNNIAALIAEVRALREDAGRYRWLRDWQADASDFCCASLEVYLPVPARDEAEPPRKHSACFDAAIDAARGTK